MMVLVGEVAAAWLIARGVPAIFRRQQPPEGGIPDVDPALPDAVRVRAVRRVLRRGETSLVPGVHHGLGLPAYVQATSPLRRFQDLAVHRQIASILTTGVPAYDAAAMQSILAATERAELDGRRAERAAQRYAMLRLLARAAGSTVTAVVVEVAPRPVVTLDETLLDETVPALVGAALGDRVRLRIERVNPRADVLVLRPA
jgi:exoribonuclease-2